MLRWEWRAIFVFWGSCLVLVSLAGSVSAQADDGEVTGALIVTMEYVQEWDGTGNPIGSWSIVHLYEYSSGDFAEIWSVPVAGWIQGTSFNDINGDGMPELVIMNDASHVGKGVVYGVDSLLIYENKWGMYELVLNQSGRANIVRGHMIDYFGNGTEYLLIPLDKVLCLIGYDQGQPVIKKRLWSYDSAGRGVAVGDLDNNGMTDILYPTSDGFIVLINEGKGVYSKQRVVSERHSIVEMGIGDLDSDGEKEVVLVGYQFGENWPTISVWKWIGGEFGRIWSYHGGSVVGADIGDVDGDGMDELVTEGAEGHSVMIWEFNQSDGSFYVSWNDTSSESVNLMYDLSLRIDVLDASGEPKIVGVGRDWYEPSMYLYIVERDSGGYRSKREFLWSRERLDWCPTLDVWPLVRVGEFGLAILIVLAPIIVGIITFNMREQEA